MPQRGEKRRLDDGNGGADEAAEAWQALRLSESSCAAAPGFWGEFERSARQGRSFDARRDARAGAACAHTGSATAAIPAARRKQIERVSRHTFVTASVVAGNWRNSEPAFPEGPDGRPHAFDAFGNGLAATGLDAASGAIVIRKSANDENFRGVGIHVFLNYGQCQREIGLGRVPREMPCA